MVRAAVPSLVDMLKDEKGLTRQAAALRALGNIGPDAEAAVPELSRLIDSRNALVRGEAAAALVRVGPHSKEAGQALVKILRSPDPLLHSRVNSGLPGEKPGPEVCGPVAELLKDQDADVRARAVQFLARSAPPDEALLPRFQDALKDDDPRVAVVAAEVVWRSKPSKAVIPALVKGLGAGESGLQVRAARLLGIIGADAREAVPALRKAAASKESSVRLEAIRALQQIDPDVLKSS